MTTTLTLGSGWLETDMPEHMKNPTAWTWTQAVALYNLKAGATVQFEPALIGRTGTLTATVQEPHKTLNEATQIVRQYAPIPAEGDTLTLGTGTLRLRQRAVAGMTPRDWDDTRYPLTAIGLTSADLDSEAMRILFCQPVTLQLTTQ